MWTVAINELTHISTNHSIQSGSLLVNDVKTQPENCSSNCWESDAQMLSIKWVFIQLAKWADFSLKPVINFHIHLVGEGKWMELKNIMWSTQQQNPLSQDIVFSHWNSAWYKWIKDKNIRHCDNKNHFFWILL